MSWIGNLLNFEKFNLGEIGNKIGKNPERLLIGAVDPFSSRVWGGLLGKDYTPMVDQFGGASPDTYQKAEAAGIDTSAGKGMHNIAHAVAAAYAGGYGANQLGFGGAQAAPADYYTTGATEGSTFGNSLTGAGGSSGAVGQGTSASSMQGLLGVANNVPNYMKMAGDAASAAQNVRGLFGQQQQMAPPMMQQQHQTQDPIGQILAQQAQLEELRRRARLGLLNGTA